MASKVSYKQGSKATYLGLLARNPDALYFCTDTHELFRGDDLYSDGLRIVGSYQALPTYAFAADGIIYFCKDTGCGYVLNEARDGWINVIHGVDNKTIVADENGLLRVDVIPISSVAGLEEKLANINNGTVSSGVITSVSDELTVSDSGMLSIRAVEQVKVIGLEDKLASIEKSISGGNADCVGVEPADGDIPQVYLTGVDGADAPITKTEVDFKLHYVSKTEEFTAFCTLKLQGDSSASTAYKKKNYTVKMFSDATHETKLKKEFRDWGFKTNKYILKANWIDATHARQMVAYDIWSKIVKTREGYADSVEATLPNQGTSDGFPVVVYINGTYYGIYTWILPKSDTLFGVDEDNANQFVIYGQLNTDGTYRKTANNFRELWSGVNVDNWEIEVGTNSNIVKTAVNNFTNFVMTATDEEFYNNLGDYCNVQSLIDGYLFDYYLCGIDALAQNMILICRDGETFTLGVWDRDSTFGLWWNGSKILPTDYRCPEDYQEPYSLLWARLEGTFYNELKTRKAELRADGAPLSFGNIVGTFDTFVHNIGDDRYDENNAAYTQPSKTTATKKQFREFVRDRLAYVDSCVDAFGTVIKCADITLTESDLVITENHALTPVLVPRATTQEIVWQSSNENVAVVINGIITPVANGDTVITATCGQYSASCNVTVSGASEAVPCTGISLDAETLTFTAEGSQSLTATVTPDGCTDAIIWESDNTSVATVENGVVTAVANGSAVITAKCGAYAATCAVNVNGISGDITEDTVDYNLDLLTNAHWNNGYRYNNAGTLTAVANENCTDKITNPQSCVYQLSGGKHAGLSIWDENDNYVVYSERTLVMAIPAGYKVAVKAYSTETFDPTGISLKAVNNSENAVYREIDLSALTWTADSSNCVKATVTAVNMSNVDSCNYPFVSGTYGSGDIISWPYGTDLAFSLWNGGNLLLTKKFGTDMDAANTYFANNPTVLILNERKK